MDIIIRVVPNYGFLPIITLNYQEVYRGEFKNSAQEACDRAVEVATENRWL